MKNLLRNIIGLLMIFILSLVAAYAIDINKSLTQTDLIETIYQDTITTHIVEVGEHRYSINVWGNDFEHTSAKHAKSCLCK